MEDASSFISGSTCYLKSDITEACGIEVVDLWDSVSFKLIA